MKRLRIFIFTCTALAFCCASLELHAQEKSPVTVTGSATVSGDFYSFNSTPDSAEQARRPSSLMRLILTPTLNIGEYISLPFNIMLSSKETNVTTPNAKNSSFLQFIQNPMNNLGFLSFSPRVGWAQAYIGSHVPQYSELSAGDEQIFGAGIDLKPGNFRFAASAGTSQRAIDPDSINNIRGAYARHLFMAKIGYGNEEVSFMHLNVVRAKDDPASIAMKPAGVTPQEGILFSTNFRLGFADNIYLTGEAGSSAFTRDLSSDDIDHSTPIPTSLFRQRVSTRTDYAGTLAFFWNESDWGLKLSGKYIGAGYVSLGFPYLQPDRLEFQFAPRVRLFDRKVNINGSIGHRTNNLSNTMGTTSTQIIGSVNVLANISDAFSVTTRYANFGVRNNMKNDTLKVETVSNSFSISPSYIIRASSIIHTITASYSLDAFSDYNVITGAQGSNNTQNIMALYAASFVDSPLLLNATASRMTNDLPANKLTIHSATLGVSYKLWEGAVLPSLSASYTENTLGSFTADKQLFIRLSMQWNITQWLAMNLAVSGNDYKYGSSRPGVSFNETFFETALSTSF